jgi:hypothetical protein
MKHKLRTISLGLLVMAALAVGFIGCGGCHRMPDQFGFASVTKPPEPAEPVLQLRCAKIPWVAWVACHTWFAEYSTAEGRWVRWEVWQTSGGKAFGHVRKDLMPAGSGVGAGPSWVLAEWRGEEAQRLRAVLNRPEDYPWPHEYRYVPGPNSNTYTAWVLRQAGIDCPLPPAAIGKGYGK